MAEYGTVAEPERYREINPDTPANPPGEPALMKAMTSLRNMIEIMGDEIDAIGKRLIIVLQPQVEKEAGGPELLQPSPPISPLMDLIQSTEGEVDHLSNRLREMRSRLET